MVLRDVRHKRSFKRLVLLLCICVVVRAIWQDAICRQLFWTVRVCVCVYNESAWIVYYVVKIYLCMLFWGYY